MQYESVYFFLIKSSEFVFLFPNFVNWFFFIKRLFFRFHKKEKHEHKIFLTIWICAIFNTNVIITFRSSFERKKRTLLKNSVPNFCDFYSRLRRTISIFFALFYSLASIALRVAATEQKRDN